ncbi:MAG TPA: MarC family protein [Acidobacteriaceae bacterium]|nr:MarC family protein [Acidobacteriaceae bacterium]
MIDVLNEALSITRATILVTGALFPIVNPLGSAAIFLNLIGPTTPKIQRLLAQKITVYSFFLLVCSLLWGVKVLSFFGISIFAVQIGGGLVVASTGWALLSQSPQGSNTPATEDSDILAKAFYPYTLPITVGPGSISVAITLGAHLPAELHSSSVFSPGVLIASMVGIAVICLIVYLCYRYAREAERLLGATGTSVFMRLSSFILLCIGIQIISTGVKSYLATLAAR